MPEYLAPGVYVEETSFRAKSIEGVSTSTAGFVGPARYGPISGDPELLVSFADFQRIYGGLEDIEGLGSEVNYLAHAVRAFFEEGGKRCYVMRVFNRGNNATSMTGHAILNGPQGGNIPDGTNIVARFPGTMGNMRVRFSVRIARDVRGSDTPAPNPRATLTRVRAGDLVYVDQLQASTASDKTPNTFDPSKIFVLSGEGTATNPWALAAPSPPGAASTPLGTGQFANSRVYPITVSVQVQPPASAGRFGEAVEIGEFALDDLLQMLSQSPPTPYAALTVPVMIVNFSGGTMAAPGDIRQVVTDLMGATAPKFGINQPFELPESDLTGGINGSIPQADDYIGDESGFVDLVNTDAFTRAKNGLLAFEAVPDISIVAAPAAVDAGFGQSGQPAIDAVLGINKAVINHCTTMKYRVAVLDINENQTVSTALDQRNLMSSKYAAIYYPWIYVMDPRPGKGGQRLKLPPSGFVAGIYARNDVERAVFKAPANEVVRTAIDFEQRLSKAHQEVLNPEGVNCFRFFEGRGFLLWGARTISPDPEYKYVSVRRYFCYLEYSIERGTQWAVFENNDEPLWANVRRTIEDFLFNEWKRGGLMGEKPEKAYFVRCDRTTMTQNDLDNGRLVCLIGVAPVKPAEFVIFRIGQWTADSPLNQR